MREVLMTRDDAADVVPVVRDGDDVDDAGGTREGVHTLAFD